MKIARRAVIKALNKNASYVDINCNDDLAILLSSGYTAVSTNRAQSVLNPPQILAVKHSQSGKLKLGVKTDRNTKSFLGRIKTDANESEFGPSISFKNSRSIIFKACVAGTTYIMELCAIGGSTGQSDWSEPYSDEYSLGQRTPKTFGSGGLAVLVTIDCRPLSSDNARLHQP